MVLAVALAGCSDGGGGDVPPTTPPTPDEEAIEDFEDPMHFCAQSRDPDRQHAPDLEGRPWAIGQYWGFSLKVDDGEADSTRLVYYGDQDRGQHYMVGTTSREKALEHAVFSTNPMLGRIHRALYSPHESGDHADMFHFPLCDGSTWETTFYGERFVLQAEAADVEVPGLGVRPGFVVRGASQAGSTLVHTYSLDAQWFTTIDLDQADGGTVDMRLEAMGGGYAGPAYFLRGQNDEVVDLGGPVLGINETTISREDGTEGPYNAVALYLGLRRASGTGHATVGLAAPNGTVMLSAEVGDVAGQEAVELLVEVPFSAGDWTLTRTTLPPNAAPGLPTIQVEGTLRVVSVYDRSGEA